MAVAFTKVADFVEATPEKQHDLGSDDLVIALSVTAPGSETSDPTATGNGILANVTQIAYTYLNNLAGRTLAVTTSAESGGTYTLDADNITITATGGTAAAFRYVYIYNDTSATPDDQLIGMYDYGSNVTLADTETLEIAFHADGILTIV